MLAVRACRLWQQQRGGCRGQLQQGTSTLDASHRPWARRIRKWQQ